MLCIFKTLFLCVCDASLITNSIANDGMLASFYKCVICDCLNCCHDKRYGTFHIFRSFVFSLYLSRLAISHTFHLKSRLCVCIWYWIKRITFDKNSAKKAVTHNMHLFNYERFYSNYQKNEQSFMSVCLITFISMLFFYKINLSKRSFLHSLICLLFDSTFLTFRYCYYSWLLSLITVNVELCRSYCTVICVISLACSVWVQAHFFLPLFIKHVVRT